MIVDDEMIVRESFKLWFEKGGHMVDTAASGFEALEKLEKYPFDLLFVDNWRDYLHETTIAQR